MAKLKFKLSYLLGLLFPFASFNAIADEPKVAGSEEEAAKEATGELSAGAIAAAVAAVSAAVTSACENGVSSAAIAAAVAASSAAVTSACENGVSSLPPQAARERAIKEAPPARAAFVFFFSQVAVSFFTSSLCLLEAFARTLAVK